MEKYFKTGDVVRIISVTNYELEKELIGHKGILGNVYSNEMAFVNLIVPTEKVYGILLPIYCLEHCN